MADTHNSNNIPQTPPLPGTPSGNLPYRLTNDYLFRAVFQSWPERSLSYACRSFDQLHHGINYGQVRPVIHIGFLDFTLFPEYPEFYATYMLSNIKNHQIYSDKLRISVVNLNQTALATKDDKEYGIDLRASLMKATTWEVIHTLAQKNKYLGETASAIRKLTEDEEIRQQCQAREDYYFWENYKNQQHKKELEEAQDIIRQKDKEITRLLAELEALKHPHN